MKPETLEKLIESTNDLIETSKISIQLLQEEKARNTALLKICGETHQYLNTKNDKTWIEEDICRKIYSNLTNIPSKPIP